jgi:hypothetical protein
LGTSVALENASFVDAVDWPDGQDFDFSLLPGIAVQQMLQLGVPVEIADVLRRGFRILVDKDGLAEQLTKHSVLA